MGDTYVARSGPDLGRLAEQQHGVVSREQAIRSGAHPRAIDRWIAAGIWERMYAGVYRLAGAPTTWKQSLLAAWLAWGDGAVISHRSAAALHELIGFNADRIELTVPRKRERALPHRVHRPRELNKVDITVVEAIPVTTPARTLIDLATCVNKDTLEEALDDALRRRLVSLPKLRSRMGELGARKVLTKLVDARAHGPLTESRLETRVLRAIRAAGLPKPKIQHRVGNYRVDFAYPADHIAIECDGYRYHSSRRSFDADRARRNALSLQGWTVLHVTWAELYQFVETLSALIA